MHNRALHDTLAAFVEEAASQLADEVSGGAEIPFDLVMTAPSRTAAPLYCYSPQTVRFISERSGALGRLASYVPAVHGLMALQGLDAYLQALGQRREGDARRRADAALQAFLCAVWEDATDFAFDPRRFETAYAALERTAYAGRSLSLVLCPVEGLVIESREVQLGEGLTLVRGVDLGDAPPELRGDEFATVAVLALEGDPGAGDALARAGRRLRHLQTALRLWDEAEPALGPTAWARTDGGPWMAVPLPMGMRRETADCLLAVDEEDPLRAFCSLVARRSPRSGELAWALRRFELGCERGTPTDALTDWLLCARALFAELDGIGHERVAERLAAICATPEERSGLVDSLRRAMALERAVVAGIARPDPGVDALIATLGGCLRAVLRDVLCGHLEPELRRVADDLLADVAPA